MLVFLLGNSLLLLSPLVFPLFSQFQKNCLKKKKNKTTHNPLIQTLAELETNFVQRDFPCWLVTLRACVQTVLCRALCPQTFAWTELKGVSLWILPNCSWKWWILPFLDNVRALPTPGWEAVSSKSSQATLKITKRLRQQKSRIKKAAVTLETRQRLKDSPSHMTLGTTSTECLESVQHKLFSKPATLKWESLLSGKTHHFIQAHADALTPTYFCDFSYFFYCCSAMMFSKFVMIRFKALPVVQTLVTYIRAQKYEICLSCRRLPCDNYYVKMSSIKFNINHFLLQL